ncbi:hypothetical protein B566_EDAN014008 [Ephemera danica]|nr:hypothetical protein B566_EDAN014008 [Ephemera danica]
MSYGNDSDDGEPSNLFVQPQLVHVKKPKRSVADDDFVGSFGGGGKEDYIWKKGEKGTVPQGAIIACRSNNLGDIYVGRCSHKGEVLPGKFIPRLKCCIVGYEGEEVKKYNYEVLCNVKAEWIPMNAGQQNVPNKAVLGGRTQDSEPLYIGRVLEKSSVGKVLQGACLVVYGNKEHVHKNFEVLVSSSNPTETKSNRYSGYEDPQHSSMMNWRVTDDQHNLMKTTRGQHTPSAPRGSTYDSDEEEQSYSRAQSHQLYGAKPKSRYVPDDGFVHHGYREEDDDKEPSRYKIYGVKPSSSSVADFVVSSGGGDVAWIRARNGDYPPNAVVGGSNHLEDIYVARAKFQGQLIPGKLIPTYRSCFITVNGIEMRIKDYEVLQCNQPMMLEWNAMEKGDGIPMNAVEGGVDDVGDTFFIGRAEHGNNAIVGKVEQSTQLCLILCANQEHAYYNYDILVYSDTYLKKYAVTHLTSAMRMMQAVQNGNSSPNIPSSSGPTQPSLLQPPSRPTLDAGSVANSASSTVRGRKSTLKSGFSVEQLAPTDSTYKWVEEKMKKDSQVNYNIVKIERILNENLWLRYRNYRHLVAKLENNDDANEKRLFHGSGQCQTIIKNGFDERLSKQNGLYGAGVYFADKADKSNSYVGPGNSAGEFQMLLCRVALGKIHDCPQNKTFSHAPPGCHSVCGGTAFKEYIVYRGEQAFPGFLITYKK